MEDMGLKTNKGDLKQRKLQAKQVDLNARWPRMLPPPHHFEISQPSSKDMYMPCLLFATKETLLWEGLVLESPHWCQQAEGCHEGDVQRCWPTRLLLKSFTLLNSMYQALPQQRWANYPGNQWSSPSFCLFSDRPMASSMETSIDCWVKWHLTLYDYYVLLFIVYWPLCHCWSLLKLPFYCIIKYCSPSMILYNLIHGNNKRQGLDWGVISMNIQLSLFYFLIRKSLLVTLFRKQLKIPFIVQTNGIMM